MRGPNVHPAPSEAVRERRLSAGLTQQQLAHQARCSLSALQRHLWVSRGVATRAQRAWKTAQLEPIGLHECRHMFASLMIGAGVNAKALASYVGHASVTITFDRIAT